MSSFEHQNTPDRLGKVDTLAQASSRTGFSIAELRLAKRNGCPAFKGGSRVDLDELCAWIAANPTNTADADKLPEKDILERQLLAARLQKIQFELAVARGEYISKTDRDQSDIATAAAAKGQLMALANEVPNWEGFPAHKLKTNIDAAVHTICANLHNRQSGAYKS